MKQTIEALEVRKDKLMKKDAMMNANIIRKIDREIRNLKK